MFSERLFDSKNSAKDLMNETIKTNTNQSINISKEIAKKARNDPNFSKVLVETINSIHSSLFPFNTKISLAERLLYLQQIASSVNFCFIQDDSSSQSTSYSIIVGGNNLVVDFNISTKGTKKIFEVPSSVQNSPCDGLITCKLSFASSNEEMSLTLIEYIEKRLSLLLEGNDFEELKNLFRFFQIIDCEDSARHAYFANMEALFKYNLQPLYNLTLNDFIGSICWNRIGTFDFINGAFVRIFYYANLEVLYSCGLLFPTKQSHPYLTAEKCALQWKNQIYYADVSWNTSEYVDIELVPPIFLDQKISENFQIESPTFNLESLKLEKCKLTGMDKFMSFIDAVKLSLICNEIDSNNQFCMNENLISVPCEESLVTVRVTAPDSIDVFLDDSLCKKASIAAVKSRNWKIIKSFIQCSTSSNNKQS